MEGVQITYRQYEQCHKIVNAPESISELQRWQKQVISDRTLLADSASLANWVLPEKGMDPSTQEI